MYRKKLKVIYLSNLNTTIYNHTFFLKPSMYNLLNTQ